MKFKIKICFKKGKEKNEEQPDESQILLSHKQAELLALQNQINPHFLYNTLDAIRGDALKAGVKNIADITEALSIYFRYTISETRSLVSLMEELENVDNYFMIQQYRFGNKLQMELMTVDDEVLNFMCPKLMLQPIIENAIFHGIERKVGGGLISIKIEELSNKIRIIVSDNGVGISENKLEELNQNLKKADLDTDNKRHGIALHNVNKRIKLLFGNEYGIWIFSVENVGTSVNIELPIKKENEYERRNTSISKS